MGKPAVSASIDTRELRKQVKRFLSTKSPKLRRKTARALFFVLLGKVILKTPVDTGRARGGWGAGIDELGIRGVPEQGSPAYEEGKALSEFRVDSTGNTIRLSVTNNVEYIEFLEAGTSTQAPFGMVRISIRELEEKLGGRKLPKGIDKAYTQAWEALGFEKGTELRARDLMEGLGLTPGLNVGAL